MPAKKHFEINPAEKQILVALNKKVDGKKDDKSIKDWIKLWYETVLFSPGLSLESPEDHTSRIQNSMQTFKERTRAGKLRYQETNGFGMSEVANKILSF